jgi:tetratricopeptide (TPR) repeat protein
MKVLLLSSTGQPISLLEELARGGEGSVWSTNQPGLVAKLYQQPTPERFKKLEVMVANPPIDPTKAQNHTSIVWPKDLLKDNQGAYQGFVMPSIPQGKELPKVYTPKLRKAFAPEFNWQYLHTTAQNLALTVQAIHDGGYVLGDINPRNILVNRQALPSIIDTDSFQVQDPKDGKIYRCTVGMAEFTPPELINQDFSTLSQTPFQDYFRLGIIIHYLLFGDHPFKGKWIGSGDSPNPIASISRGLWPYGSDRQMVAGPLNIPLEVVHPALKDCFLECFNVGHGQPDRRPTARAWYEALTQAASDLKVCSRNINHYYAGHYRKCYWCERGQTLNFDVFALPNTPSTTQVSKIPRSKQSAPVVSSSAQQGVTPKILSSWTNSTSVTKLFFNPGVIALLSLIIVLASIFFLTSPGESYLEQGIRHYKAGDNVKALEDYNQAIKLDPKYADAYKYRAVVYRELGDRTKALADYSQALKLDPKYTDAYFSRGIFYQRIADNKRALADYNQALKLNPKYIDAYLNRGFLYQNMGNNTKALEDYNKALTINPKYIDAYYNRGDLYNKMGDHTKAVEDYNEALNLKPDVGAYIKRADFYQNIGNNIKALDDYNEALKFSPKYFALYLNRAMLYEKLGENKKALRDYNQAIMLDPKNAYTYSNRGFIYQNLGDNTKSLEDYNQVLKLDPKDAITYYNRGLSYESLGDKIKVLSDYNQALRFDPKYAIAYNNRGNLYRILGEKTKALEDLNKALKLNPKNVYAYNNRGLVYQNLENNTKALEDYNQALKLDPAFAYAYANRGILYEKLGEKTKALEDYHQAMKLNPKLAEVLLQ